MKSNKLEVRLLYLQPLELNKTRMQNKWITTIKTNTEALHEEFYCKDHIRFDFSISKTCFSSNWIEPMWLVYILQMICDMNSSRPDASHQDTLFSSDTKISLHHLQQSSINQQQQPDCVLQTFKCGGFFCYNGMIVLMTEFSDAWRDLFCKSFIKS